MSINNGNTVQNNSSPFFNTFGTGSTPSLNFPGATTNIMSSTPKVVPGQPNPYSNTPNAYISPQSANQINSGAAPSSFSSPTNISSGFFPGVSAPQTTNGVNQPVPQTPPTPTFQNTPETAALNAQANGVPGAWQNYVASLGNTQPTQNTNNAVTSLQGQANGTNPASPFITALQGLMTTPSPAVQQAENNLAGLQRQQGYIANNPNVAAGVAGGLAQNFGTEVQAGETGVQNALAQQGQQITAGQYGGQQALTGQQQQIGAATNAGSLANTAQQTQVGAQTAASGAAQPQLGGYGQTYYNPVTGSTVNNGSNLDPSTQAQNYAQQVISGKMSYQDAVNSMGYAGSAGQTFLNNAIQSASPGFNINQAQNNTQTQGQLNPQASLAQQELQNLQGTLNNLPDLQQTSVPIFNSFSRWIGGLLGNANSQALNDAQSAATSAVETALGTAYGGTPSSFDALVKGWFPPGATAAQVQAGISQFNALMTARQNSFTSPGATSFTPNTQTNTQTNTGGFSSFYAPQ